jgi:hypothetical protein
MRATNQSHILAGFHSLQINALFSTSVAEEGLDVQNCTLVICYDVPTRPLSVVQTMGRARAVDSQVFFMVPNLPADLRQTVCAALCSKPGVCLGLVLGPKYGIQLQRSFVGLVCVHSATVLLPAATCTTGCCQEDGRVQL